MPHPRTRYYSTHILTPRDHAPSGYVRAAFKETSWDSSSYETGYITGWEADLKVNRTTTAKGEATKCGS